ncbi:hypothetical protein COV24_04630 [candidate division WWE3 bacterium CG10_big_fil_rev_8_21_14_0_10_32_10]|uniref:Uncharacterized protein n=1 Tax=candidate division WWE3 bacterium CG10_big_fil_rev_8_21_14_0_10_32_10 TaxID=1975090 RepID=A0A2H0R9A3_UNCKA|nr:MAG: hypothetical protein COV24_04630 [candidate division WWE3 bacterium CG10_big_fil_rev_8_21_14_0_10_32_10]
MRIYLFLTLNEKLYQKSIAGIDVVLRGTAVCLYDNQFPITIGFLADPMLLEGLSYWVELQSNYPKNLELLLNSNGWELVNTRENLATINALQTRVDEINLVNPTRMYPITRIFEMQKMLNKGAVALYWFVSSKLIGLRVIGQVIRVGAQFGSSRTNFKLGEFDRENFFVRMQAPARTDRASTRIRDLVKKNEEVYPYEDFLKWLGFQSIG